MTYKTISIDVLVIGGGTAGGNAARKAKKMGASVCRIVYDIGSVFNTCVQVGCMPSKAALALALADKKHAKINNHAGIHYTQNNPTLLDVMTYAKSQASRLVNYIKAPIQESDDVIFGYAKVVDKNTVEVFDGDMVTYRISFLTLVLATGSKSNDISKNLNKDKSQRVITNETVWNETDLPKAITVIGAGAIGIELGQLYAALGSEVKIVVGRSGNIAGIKQGHFQEIYKDGLHSVTPSISFVSHDYDYSKDLVVLNAAGRSPVYIEGYEKLLLAPLEQGRLALEGETMNCRAKDGGTSHVFICGDASSYGTVHEAAYTGDLAGENAARCAQSEHAIQKSPLLNFSVVFSYPQYAEIGTCKEDGSLITSHFRSFANQGRSHLEATNQGGVTLFVTRGINSQEIIGAQICHPYAEWIAGILQEWIISKKSITSILESYIFYHPTVPEGIKGLLEDIEKAT